MAGAGQPWFMPLLWPVGHVWDAVTRDKDAKPNVPKATADLDLVGHATSAIAATRSFLIAYIIIFYFYAADM